MTRPGLLRGLQIAVTLALMALLWSQVDMDEAGRRLSQTVPGWLLAAIAVLIVQTGLAALRWKVTARIFGLEIGAAAATREYFLAQIVNQSLPGGVLGDVGRAVRARHAAGLMRAGKSVLIERLWGQIALFAVMLVAVTAVSAAPGGLVLPEILVSSVALAALVAAVAVLGLAFAPRLPGAAVLRQGLLSPAAWPAQGLLSLGTVGANLLAFSFCARATGTTLSPGAIMTLIPVILFTMVVPLSVSGWGLREGAAVALFPLAGASPEAGLAASVTFGLVFLVSSLPGLPVLLLDRAGVRATAAPEDAAEDFGAVALAPTSRTSRLGTTRR